MRLLRNKLCIACMLIFLISLSGCTSKQYDEKYIIDYEQIYTQLEDEYYVYFYKDDCPYCEDTFEIINKYLRLNDNQQYQKLYVCDLTDETYYTYEIETISSLNTKSSITLKDDEIYSYSDDIKSIKKFFNRYVIEFTNDKKTSFSIKDNEVILYDEYIIKMQLIEIKKNDLIKRAYTGDNGQGTNGTYFVDGVKNYQDLYISGVPSLIRISKDDISYFVTSGRKSIIQYFEKIIIE